MAQREVTLGNYVGGEWRGARSGETYEKRNPMRPDEVVGEFPACASTGRGETWDSPRA